MLFLLLLEWEETTAESSGKEAPRPVIAQNWWLNLSFFFNYIHAMQDKKLKPDVWDKELTDHLASSPPFLEGKGRNGDLMWERRGEEGNDGGERMIMVQEAVRAAGLTSSSAHSVGWA